VGVGKEERQKGRELQGSLTDRDSNFRAVRVRSPASCLYSPPCAAACSSVSTCAFCEKTPRRNKPCHQCVFRADAIVDRRVHSRTRVLTKRLKKSCVAGPAPSVSAASAAAAPMLSRVGLVKRDIFIISLNTMSGENAPQTATLRCWSKKDAEEATDTVACVYMCVRVGREGRHLLHQRCSRRHCRCPS
jgi:hypothetical protein